MQTADGAPAGSGCPLLQSDLADLMSSTARQAGPNAKASASFTAGMNGSTRAGRQLRPASGLQRGASGTATTFEPSPPPSASQTLTRDGSRGAYALAEAGGSGSLQRTVSAGASLLRWGAQLLADVPQQPVGT
jgi:hypothetical protein